MRDANSDYASKTSHVAQTSRNPLASKVENVPSVPGLEGRINRIGYLSISEDQFRMTDKGAEFSVSTFVFTRNFCPSELTS